MAAQALRARFARSARGAGGGCHSGRLIDLIKRGEVKLGDVHTVILDEADEMLNMGFLDDIREILTHVPGDRKMLMFSATMPKEIAEISKEFMHSPVEFVAGNKNEAKNVRHIFTW